MVPLFALWISNFNWVSLIKYSLQAQWHRVVQFLSDADSWKRLSVCENLKKMAKKRNLDRVWFADKKRRLQIRRVMLCTQMWVQRRIWQTNDCWRAKHFSQSKMVSAVVSKFGNVSVHPWAKVYKCIVVKMSWKELLPEIHHISDNADKRYHFPTGGSVSRATRRHVTQLLNLHCHGVSELIEPENCPSNSPDLSPVTHCCGELLRWKLYRQSSGDVGHLERFSFNCWDQLGHSKQTRRLINCR